MEDKSQLDQNLSILSSILYLRSELKSAGFDRVETLLGYASYLFFEELDAQEKLTDDIVITRDILSQVEKMPAHKIKEALRMIQVYNPLNDNKPPKL